MSAICEWCPFVRGCDVCAFQGGEMPADNDREEPETHGTQADVGP